MTAPSLTVPPAVDPVQGGGPTPTEAPQREMAPAADDKICWIEVQQSPYPPDQQVELLHLQAEAEALLLQLQAMHQRRQQPGDRP
jgi:hypothetical protein